MKAVYAVVDLFAGPGGLAEGFSSVVANGHKPFSIVLSVEKDAHAHKTLLLRSFLRQFETYPTQYYDFLNERTPEPDWEKLYPAQWAKASEEALQLELGNPAQTNVLNKRLDEIRETHGDKIVLIGGPPCQAYSLAGRVRNNGKKGYVAEDDHRHFLYKEYIRILKRLQPVAFVMENVKGLLSSSVDGELIFDRVLGDLRTCGKGDDSYTLVPLSPKQRRAASAANANDLPRDSRDYVLRSEDFGIPQARHRVILVGVRKASLGGESLIKAALPKPIAKKVPVKAILLGMPRLRSGLSESSDTPELWKRELRSAISEVSKLEYELNHRAGAQLAQAMKQYVKLSKGSRLPKFRTKSVPTGIGRTCPPKMKKWLMDSRLTRLPNNETRSHMHSDLRRYFYASAFGETFGVSPKAMDFPAALAPNHGNWDSGNFSDRFRVQLWDAPSTTITSHISKDGHYFIHPDPLQCRSLTVREAARLQTFPDNYFFNASFATA